MRPVLWAAIGLIAGSALTWALRPDGNEPEIVQGVVTAVNEEVTAIVVRLDDHDYETPGDGEGLPMAADVPWTDAAGDSFGGTPPTCLAPGSSGQRVELALAELGGEGKWPPRLVVWVHCLS